MIVIIEPKPCQIRILSGMWTEDYSPVPVFTARKTGIGFSVIRLTDSRFDSSAIAA